MTKSFCYTDDIFCNPPEDRLKNAFFISCLLHGALLALLCASFFAHNNDIIQPKPILIHSVKLQPKTMKQMASKPKMPPSQPKVEQPQQEKEIIALQEEITTKEPLSKKETVEQKEPAHESTPIVKKVPTEKQALKPTSHSQTKKAIPTKKVPSPTPSKKSQETKTSTLNKEVADTVQALLTQARLQRSNKTKGSSKGSATPACNHMSQLSFESDNASGDDIAYQEMTAEESYISSLVRLIQLSITISDKEPVSLKITLLKSGALKALNIISCPSSRNRHSVEKGLSAIRYPAFNSAYTGEKEHTFTLKLNREMEWSSSGR